MSLGSYPISSITLGGRVSILARIQTKLRNQWAVLTTRVKNKNVVQIGSKPLSTLTTTPQKKTVV